MKTFITKNIGAGYYHQEQRTINNEDVCILSPAPKGDNFTYWFSEEELALVYPFRFN